MTDASPTDQPTPVPTEAMRVDAVRARWAWTAPEVWTERMLTALEQGVRGGRWYTLMDKVYAVPTLRAAFGRVKANRGAAGVDRPSAVAASLLHSTGAVLLDARPCCCPSVLCEVTP